MTTQPLHNHDCESCIFLGSINGADLYVCKAYHQRDGGCVVVVEAYYRAIKLQKEGSVN